MAGARSRPADFLKDGPLDGLMDGLTESRPGECSRCPGECARSGGNPINAPKDPSGLPGALIDVPLRLNEGSPEVLSWWWA